MPDQDNNREPPNKDSTSKTLMEKVRLIQERVQQREIRL